jgi:NAD(P)H-dependent flavin oxidoreductase YrpB (nitropropane dioxygenase family)
MSEPLFRTRITELFGIRLPLIAGGLHWLANADYVAAAVNAGIMGFITAASFPDNDTLRAEIRRCRTLAGGKPFGVNISMLPKLAPHERVEEIIDVVLEEGIPFVETSGRSPEAYLPRLRAGGVKVMHKVPAVKYALKAQELGVDAVALVGAECGGHPGLDVIGTFVQTAMAARSLRIPYVVGGGVGTGAHIVAALALGADGVLVGTRFLTCEEIRAHPDYKRRLIEADETHTALILHSLRNTMRVLRNDTATEVMEIERRGEGTLERLLPLVSGKVGRAAYETGDTSRGALSVGQAVVFADRVEPLGAIVARFEQEARDSYSRLRALAGDTVPEETRSLIAS